MRVREEFQAGRFAFIAEDEDIHMAIERRLSELVGPVGGKLHMAARATTRWPQTWLCTSGQSACAWERRRCEADGRVAGVR